MVRASTGKRSRDRTERWCPLTTSDPVPPQRVQEAEYALLGGAARVLVRNARIR